MFHLSNLSLLFELHHNPFFGATSRRHLFWCYKLHLHHLRGIGTVRHSELGHRGDLRQLHAHRECPGSRKKPRGAWNLLIFVAGGSLPQLEDVLMKIDGLIIIYVVMH